MPQPGEPGWPGTGEPVLPDSDEPDTLPDLFGSDLAHLFDYCCALLAHDAEAARTGRSVLDAAPAPLPDRDRLRAWLFALARRQALALQPPSGDEPCYMPRALIAASGQQTDSGVLRALRALTHRDREILDLVYRHGIRPADVPEVLGVSAEEACRCLVNAEEKFISLVAEPEAGPGDLEDIAALPLAALPLATLPTAEGERQLGHWPARQLARAALWRMIAQRRVQLAAAAVIPVAASVGAVVYLAAPGHPAASRDASVMPRSAAGHASQRASTPSPAPARPAARAKHSSVPGWPVPIASRTATPVPTPTSSPSSTPNPSPPPPSPKPKPSPKPPPSPKPKPSPKPPP